MKSTPKAKSKSKTLIRESIMDRVEMELRGREHARRIKQLKSTVDHVRRLADKHSDYASLHDEIGENPSHPKHVNPDYHSDKYNKHVQKARLLRSYVKAFRDELDE